MTVAQEPERRVKAHRFDPPPERRTPFDFPAKGERKIYDDTGCTGPYEFYEDGEPGNPYSIRWCQCNHPPH